MFLLTTNFVKNGHIYAIILYIFLKTVLNQTLKTFNTNFRRQWKDQKSSSPVREEFALLCDLIALTLG